MIFFKAILSAFLSLTLLSNCANRDGVNNNRDPVNGMQIESAPELTVSIILPKAGNFRAGERVTFLAEVTNSGGTVSAATTLQFYRSPDPEISMVDDTPVGTPQDVAVIAAGRSKSIDLDIMLPISPGRYHYGACVAAVEGEDALNNCSSGVMLMVDVFAPDLTVSITKPTAEIFTIKENVTFTAMVTNSGGAVSAATTLQFYRSADPEISMLDDTPVGESQDVAILSTGGSRNIGSDITMPATPGRYHYGACVIAVEGEDALNNCSSGVMIRVNVLSLSVSLTRPTAGIFTIKENVTFTAMVTNRHRRVSAATTLQFYRSTDAMLSTPTAVGSPQNVARLSVSASQNFSSVITMSATPGTYHYFACVKAIAGEDALNNCSSGVMVMVDVPDLTVGVTIPTAGAFTIRESVTFTAMITNGGGVDSALTTLQFYRSTDAMLSMPTAVGLLQDVAIIAAGGSTSISLAIMMPATAGTYHYFACVTAVEGEDDSNNCSSGVMVMIEVPELTVGITMPTAGTFITGESVTFTAMVMNGGGITSVATTLQFYRSTDSTMIYMDANREGTPQNVAIIAAGGSTSISLAIMMPATAGTYHYGACVTAVEGEDDSNNCSPGVMITVDPAAPNLTVEIISPASGMFAPGIAVPFTARVANSGNVASTATTLQFYRSTDSTMIYMDTNSEGASQNVAAVAARDSRDITLDITIPTTIDTYHYGVCVGMLVTEATDTDSSNNCSQAVEVTVLATDTPELIVDVVKTASTAFEVGSSQTFTATVRNVGGTISAATKLRFYRSTDETISTTDDTAVGGTNSQTVAAIAVGGSLDVNLDIQVTTTAGMYHYGACVTAIVGETSTTNNCSSGKMIEVVDGYSQMRSGAAELAIGSSIKGTLSMCGSMSFDITNENDANCDGDYFKLRSSSVQGVIIYTQGSVFTEGHLFDAGGTLLSSARDVLDINNFRIAYILEANTDYFIRVTSSYDGDANPSDRIGSYTLHIEGRDITSAKKIDVPTSSMRTTTISGDKYLAFGVRYYRLELDSQKKLNFTTGDDDDNQSGVGMNIYIVNSTGEKVRHDHFDYYANSDGNYFAGFTETFKSGTYYIQLSSSVPPPRVDSEAISLETITVKLR